MQIYGQLLDNETRCVHYHGETDIIALQCAKCRKFYPCYQCHNEAEDHLFQVWQSHEFIEQAIYCGHCHSTLSITTYLKSTKCPRCQHPFNPNCAKHYHLYFQIDESIVKTAE